MNTSTNHIETRDSNHVVAVGPNNIELGEAERPGDGCNWVVKQLRWPGGWLTLGYVSGDCPPEVQRRIIESMLGAVL